MLPFQECISLHNIFIIFYGIDVDIAQFFNLILQRRDVPLHSCQIRQLLLPQGSRIAQRDLILIPHIIDLIFNGFLQFFLLGIQPVHFLVKPCHLRGKILPSVKKGLLFSGQSILALRILLQPLLRITLGFVGSFYRQKDLLYVMLLAGHLFLSGCHALLDLPFFLLMTFDLRIDSVYILFAEFLLLKHFLHFHIPLCSFCGVITL